VGTPLQIFEHPETAFVATFTGAANLWDAQVLGAAGEGRVRLRLAIGPELVVASSEDAGDLKPGDTVRLAVRPEKLVLRSPAAPPAETDLVVLRVTVEDRVYQGARTVWFVRDPAGGRKIVHQSSAASSASHPEPDFQPGSRALLCWEPHNAVLLRR
jgi:ABC-type Fe3+/spermidine/putrescine transport system ATPase subunit